MLRAGLTNLTNSISSWFTGTTNPASSAGMLSNSPVPMDEGNSVSLDLSKIVFRSHKEVKLPSATSKGKHLKFYVVDADGDEYLAATGEDQGDAHYLYQNAPAFTEFGELNCHNRKEVIMWLEMIIKESQQRASGNLGQELAHIGLPTPDNPEGLFFVGHRQEKTAYEDSRRCNKWYLIDQHGREHLAIVGEERETRDGHYQYRAEEPFASKSPLSCGNQNGVFHWLEQMVTHYAPPGQEVKPYTLRAPPAGSGDTRSMHEMSGGPVLSGEADRAHGHGEADSAHTPTKLPRLVVVDVPGRTRGTQRMTPTKTRAGHPTLGNKQRPRSPSDSGPPLTFGKRLRRGHDDGEWEGAHPMSPRSKFVPSGQTQTQRRLRGMGRSWEATPGALAALRSLDVGHKGAVRKLVLTWLTDSLSEGDARLMNLWHGTLREVWAQHSMQEQEQHPVGASPSMQPPLKAPPASPTVPAFFDDTPVKGLVDYSSDSSEDLPRPAVPQRTLATVLEEGEEEGAKHGQGEPHQEQQHQHHDPHTMRVVLECLRELRGMYLPLRVLAESGMISTVRQYCRYPHPTVAALAQSTLSHWHWVVAVRVRLLTDPSLMEEPTVAPGADTTPAPAIAAVKPAPSTSHMSSMGGLHDAGRATPSMTPPQSSTREADSAAGGRKGVARGKRGRGSGGHARAAESDDDDEVGTPATGVKHVKLEPLDDSGEKAGVVRGGRGQMARGGRRGRGVGPQGGRPRAPARGKWGGARKPRAPPASPPAASPIQAPALPPDDAAQLMDIDEMPTPIIPDSDTEPLPEAETDVDRGREEESVVVEEEEGDPSLGPPVASEVKEEGDVGMDVDVDVDVAEEEEEGSDGEGSGSEDGGAAVGGPMLGGKSLPKGLGGKTVPRAVLGGKTLPRKVAGSDDDQDEEEDEEVGEGGGDKL